MGTKPLITPDEILLEEFMIPLNLGKEDLSAQLNMSLMEISDILECKRAIDLGLAKKLSKRFGNSHKFWLNLQNDYFIISVWVLNCHLREISFCLKTAYVKH